MAGKGKIIGIRECVNCNKHIEVKHKIRMERERIFCSKKCEGEYRKSLVKDNYVCDNCGKSYHIKPSKLKLYEKHFCSMECHANYKKHAFKGEGNHQYGLKGSLNSSWKSDCKITNYGYRKIRSLNHPFRDCDDFVFEHRLVAEKFLLDDTNSVIVDGKKYLDPKLDVHHIDHNKLNNHPNNLIILTRDEHMKLHWKERNE